MSKSSCHVLCLCFLCMGWTGLDWTGRVGGVGGLRLLTSGGDRVGATQVVRLFSLAVGCLSSSSSSSSRGG